MGVLAAKLDSKTPPIFFKEPMTPDGTTGWVVSPRWLVRQYGDFRGFSWDNLKVPHIIYDPQMDPDFLPKGRILPHEDGVFIEAGAGYSGMRAILHWSEQNGITPLLRYLHDPSRSVGNFGTDGKDMVWTYGDGGQDQNGTWLNNVVMTAPFSLNADTLAKSAKKLRPDPWGIWIDPFKVGCGYAARHISTTEYNNALFVVRLSDGYSWMLKGDPLGPVLSYETPLLVTCEEIFLSLETSDHGGAIARIPLSSLGPGEPPPP